MLVGILEKIESSSEIVPVSDKKPENAIQMLGLRLAAKLEHGVERFESLFWQIGFCVYFDNVSEKSGVDRVVAGFEVEEEVFHLREESGAPKFEDENEIAGIGVAKVGLA